MRIAAPRYGLLSTIADHNRIETTTDHCPLKEPKGLAAAATTRAAEGSLGGWFCY